VKENEFINLRERILAAGSDPKKARIAAAVFKNQARREQALFFLDFMSSGSPAQQKMALRILGHFGIFEALPLLAEKIKNIAGSLSFLAEAEHKEAAFISDLREFVEAAFVITTISGTKNERLIEVCEEILKKTSDPELRFLLIKIILFGKNNFPFFLDAWPDLTEQDRRAVYLIASTTKNPFTGKIFELGLEDWKNFEFVVAEMIKNTEGIELLKKKISSLDEKSKLLVLKKLADEKIYALEEELLSIIKKHSDPESVELAVEIIKNAEKEVFPLDFFEIILHESVLSEPIRLSLELINRFFRKEAVPILINAFEKQPLFKNKTLILSGIIKNIKTYSSPDPATSLKIRDLLLPYFDRYTKEKEDFIISAIRILPQLSFAKSTQAMELRRQLIEFTKYNESEISTKLKNNAHENIAKLNQAANRLEKIESKTKRLLLLFEIEPGKIESERISFLREELRELGEISEDFRDKMLCYLTTVITDKTADWRKRSAAVELLGEYGDKQTAGVLLNLIREEKSLGVKTTAQQSLNRLRQRSVLPEPVVLLFETLFYVTKLITDFCHENEIRCLSINDLTGFSRWPGKECIAVFLSDAFLDHPDLPKLSVFLENNRQTKLLLMTSNPEIQATTSGLPRFTTLIKPFKACDLAEMLIPEN